MGFVVWNQEHRDSLRAEIIHIWAAGGFAHSEVRVIGGGAELLIGMEVVNKLSLTAYFGKRYVHVGQGEWLVTVRNGKNDGGGFPLPPTARGYATLGDSTAHIKSARFNSWPPGEISIMIAKLKRPQIRKRSGGGELATW